MGNGDSVQKKSNMETENWDIKMKDSLDEDQETVVSEDDDMPSNYPFAMPYASKQNTAPISALLRALAMTDFQQQQSLNGSKNSNQKGVKDGKGKGSLDGISAVSKVRLMLQPLDEWMSQPQEMQSSPILRRCLLVTSPGIQKKQVEEETNLEGSTVKDLLGGIGRDNLPGHDEEDLDDFDIYATSAHTARASGTLASSAYLSSMTPSPSTGTAAANREIERCFVHERVVRDLKSKSKPLSFIRDIVKDQLKGGKLTGQQYQKSVTKDVLELYLHDGLSLLYAISGKAVLILDVIYNIKQFSKGKKRAQQEMSVMLNWMAGLGLPNQEPFVFIDWTSGKLSPLYKIDITEAFDKDPDEVFNPTMLDLIMSPQQNTAVGDALAAVSQQHFKGSSYDQDMESFDSSSSIPGSGKNLRKRDPISIVVLQGSAGNGKTTCLLRSGLSRARSGENVIFIAATQIFADSVTQDLRDDIVEGFKIVVKDGFTEMIREVFRPVPSGETEGKDVTEATSAEVMAWLKDKEKRSQKKMDEGAKKALCDWLMKGHRQAADTASYDDYVLDYDAWKNDNNKRDEGDMWKEALEELTQMNEQEDDLDFIENNQNRERSRRIHQFKDNRACDAIVIDEAQLYPAETNFKTFMLWYRPRKCILLGMDTKQAVYLGCSNRKDLVSAVHMAGWHKKQVKSHSLTTNFRLPARLVALSNAMVSTLKIVFPKVFDEYQKDEGFEKRSAIEAGVLSSPDTREAAEATDAPVKAIETFPAMLVLGKAARKLRDEITKRMNANRRSVLCMRFADINSESAPANYSTTTGEKLSTLADLPTIKFQAVSGLEISLPVIVDTLLTTYVKDLCPQRIFAANEAGRNVENHEMSMLRTALCTVYTVLTRCRGPLIWLEDDMDVGDKAHPLVKTLRKELQKGIMDIDFVTNPDLIDHNFVNRLFNLQGADLEQLNAAYEDSTRQILQKFKTSFWTCGALLDNLLKQNSVSEMSTDLAAQLQASEEYRTLQSDKTLLLSQLAVSTHDEAIECSNFLQALPDTLLMKAGTGDGKWSLEWGEDLKNMLQTVELFPLTFRLALGQTTRSIATMGSTVSDGKGHMLRMEQQLARGSMRMCTCGEEPQPQDMEFIMAFKGMGLSFGQDQQSGIDPAFGSSPTMWAIHRVSSRGGKAIRRDNPRQWRCITEDSYLLSCFNVNQNEKGSNQISDVNSHMNIMMFKFQDLGELTITRANDGWLTFQERTFTPGCGSRGLVRSTSTSGGMKCRCRARGVAIAGSAKRHSYGPYVTEIDGRLKGCVMKGKRKESDLSVDILRMPPVGDKTMISLLEAIFSGKELGFQAAQLLIDESIASKQAQLDWLSPPDLQSLLHGSSSSLTSEDQNGNRAAAAFVWNNLLGGNLLFCGVEARLQPWAMLLPAVTNFLRLEDRDIDAMALLDKVRRTVEACILWDDKRIAIGNKNEAEALPVYNLKELVYKDGESVNL